MSFDLKEMSSALADVASSLQLPDDKLIQSEKYDRFSYTDEELAKGQLANFTQPKIDELLLRFSDSVTIKFKRSGADIAVFESGCNVQQQLDELSSKTQQANHVSFYWRINKAKLLDVLGVQQTEKLNWLPFLFSVTFNRLINNGIENPGEFEKEVWPSDQTQKCCVVIFDEEFSANGDFLDIVGNSASVAPNPALPSAEKLELESKRFESRRKSVGWEYEWLQYSTPSRFTTVCDEQFDSQHIHKSLSILNANVATLFMADRVRRQNGIPVATFATEKSRCEIPFLVPEDTASPALVSEHCKEWVDISNWAYGDKWEPDRLRLVQIAVAETPGLRADANSTDLLWNSPKIHEDLKWHWKTFISDEVEKYTAEERSLEAEVAETVDKLDAQVSTMTKNISATVLGAVGVFIGTFIAAAFKDKFNKDVFLVGIVAYGIYVVIFPGIYGLTHNVLTFLSAIRIHKKRQDRVSRIIGRDKTSKIVGKEIYWAKWRYWIWFGLSVLAMLLIIVACFVVADKVPRAYSG